MADKQAYQFDPAPLPLSDDTLVPVSIPGNLTRNAPLVAIRGSVWGASSDAEAAEHRAFMERANLSAQAV